MNGIQSEQRSQANWFVKRLSMVKKVAIGAGILILLFAVYVVASPESGSMSNKTATSDTKTGSKAVSQSNSQANSQSNSQTASDTSTSQK